MKSAVVNWHENYIRQMISADAVISAIEACLQQVTETGSDIMVFPALTGCLYQYLSLSCQSLGELKARADSNAFLENAAFLSGRYGVALCPGSYWEREGEDIYHTSCLIIDGNVVLKQRQLYLANWERLAGLSRGVTTGLFDMDGWKVGIVLSTDVFYPQVSRLLAMKGADIILAPVALTGIKNKAFQLSGMWQETQQNLFFTLESGFNGSLGSLNFWGNSIIHAPLEMTGSEDGMLSQEDDSSNVIFAVLDNELRKKAIRKFDVLSMLNPAFYKKMPCFGNAGISRNTETTGTAGTIGNSGTNGEVLTIGESRTTGDAGTNRGAGTNA